MIESSTRSGRRDLTVWTIASPGPLDRLTGREREVLQLAAEGQTMKQIAEALVVSAKTAEHHRSSAMAKLGLHNQTELVKYAIWVGLIQIAE